MEQLPVAHFVSLYISINRNSHLFFQLPILAYHLRWQYIPLTFWQNVNNQVFSHICYNTSIEYPKIISHQIKNIQLLFLNIPIHNIFELINFITIVFYIIISAVLIKWSKYNSNIFCLRYLINLFIISFFLLTLPKQKIIYETFIYPFKRPYVQIFKFNKLIHSQ